MSALNAVSKAHDAIGLLKMVRNVAHDKTEAKQTVMGFIESTAELFSYHQDEKLSSDNYSIMFNATVKLIKAHGEKPCHHPGLVDMHRKRVGKAIVRKEPDPEKIPATCRTEIFKTATERGNKAADNEFLACQFTLGADNSRYKNLK